MRKQTLILTAWLTLPFLCLTLIMVWIFVSLDKDKLMQDAPPVGAGAGDTGNANALGEWIAGHNPDAISKANQARREHTAINPFNWPGGTLLTFAHTPPPELDTSSLEAQITLISKGTITILIRHPNQLDDNKWGVQLQQFGPMVDSAKIAIGYTTQDSDPANWTQTPIPLSLIPNDTLSSDPIEIPIRINVMTP